MIMTRRLLAVGGLLAAHLMLSAGPSSAKAALATDADQISAMVEQAMEYPTYLPPREVEEGVALIAFTISQAGAPTDIELVAKSGHRTLDQAALRAVGKLRGLPPRVAGRHVVAVLQFCVGFPGFDPKPEQNIRVAIQRLQKRWPDVLVPTRYLR